MKPIYIHSGMTGAPQYANANGNINGILEACLINGFNLRTAASASASGGVLTLNFATNPGFEALQTVEVALADVALVNGQHRVVANASNQVTIAIAGLPDGAVGSTGAGITIKQAGAGWSKPFGASTKAVFRPPAGNRRYLRIVNAVGADTQARGYEDMTDVDTGTGPFPTVAQVATPIISHNFSWGAVNSPWFVIVSSKWMSFALASSSAAVGAAGAFQFGDPSGLVVTNDGFSSVLRLDNGQVYMCRNYAGAAGAVACSVRDFDGTTATWPSVIADGVQFLPYAPILENATNILRAVSPNAYKAYPQIPVNKFLDIYSNVAGIGGRVKPFPQNYIGIASSMTSAIAIDEEAWD